ncbi:hypothetical protein ACQ4M4_13120 [Leptolyngbya sp. AN02str]|uniref:hypothetical protein n=1 Tax=Leptolyngbya sp. AN02str TaxID=3423363 RepID=UPI003D312B00
MAFLFSSLLNSKLGRSHLSMHLTLQPVSTEMPHGLIDKAMGLFSRQLWISQ